MEYKDIKTGAILKLPDTVIETVIVLGKMNIEENIYILVAPYKEVQEDLIVSDNTKLLVLKIDEKQDIYIEQDEEIIRKVISEIFKK